jgi:hypothetical protein
MEKSNRFPAIYFLPVAFPVAEVSIDGAKHRCLVVFVRGINWN